MAKVEKPEGTLAQILVVDDDRDFLGAVENALRFDERFADCDVLTAVDGNEAINQYNEHEPEVVILDLMLPKRSGFLVFEDIERGKGRMDLPHVVMVTGNIGSRHKAYAGSLGVDDYLHKPCRMEKLMDVVNGYVKDVARG
ncbi:two-component system response regulator [Candidatus Pacearchaeota archaeon]|nr:two-component system response regulator [Candidatus Pacearchaeota archaeon]|tara:strand:+ start:2472 stop:2894 length:423 start_codon:yes stop_codon:yes gene_type:complete